MLQIFKYMGTSPESFYVCDDGCWYLWDKGNWRPAAAVPQTHMKELSTIGWGSMYESFLNRNISHRDNRPTIPGNVSDLTENPKKDIPPSCFTNQQKHCRFCGSFDIKSGCNNGIIGPGYVEWGFYCGCCGKIQ